MTAHVSGLPLEEALPGLAATGTAVVAAVAIEGRARLSGIVRWLRRR